MLYRIILWPNAVGGPAVAHEDQSGGDCDVERGGCAFNDVGGIARVGQAASILIAPSGSGRAHGVLCSEGVAVHGILVEVTRQQVSQAVVLEGRRPKL